MDEFDYGQCDYCGEDNDISGHCVDSFCEYYAGTPEHDALIEEFGEDAVTGRQKGIDYELSYEC